VLLRDLEELRSERIAAENPPVEAVEPVREPSVEMELVPENGKEESNQPTPQPFIKEENPAPDVAEAPSTTQDPPKETIAKIPDLPKAVQAPSTPSSNDTKIKPDSIGLDISTTTAATLATSPQSIADLQDSSIDSLFDMPDDSSNNAALDLNIGDAMDYLNDSTDHDNSQAQNLEFDISSFGNNPQDFNMADIQSSNGAQNTNNSTGNAQDDLYSLVNAAGGDEMIDVDINIRPAEESSFEELYFTGEDGGLSGGAEFDDAFFGLDA